MTQWYITRYARLLNGEVELISYTKAANFEVACSAEHINLPNNQFYHAESRIGNLLPELKLYWVARDKYSHKPKVAELQAEAEIKAQFILNAEDLEFAPTMQFLKDIKGLLTKAQYDTVFKATMRKPSVMKYLYERNN